MATKLLMTVKEMADRDAWLKQRINGIGGSDAGVIVGLNKWKSPYTLWQEKTGATTAQDLSDVECVYWGQTLEQLVADEFCKRTGKKVRKHGLLQSVENPFMLASVDRLVVGENAGLECKTTNAYSLEEWTGDNIPDSYYCQCQHYMAVTGFEKWYIACLIGGNKFVWKTVNRNDDDIQVLISSEGDFWENVLTKTPPPIDGSQSCTDFLKAKYKGGQKNAVELPSNLKTDVQEYLILQQNIKEQQKLLDEAKNNLCAALGDNEVGVVADYSVEWKCRAGSVTVDTKRLKEEQPAIFEQYKKQGAGTRVFAIKTKKEN